MTDTTVRYVRLSGGPEAEAKCGAGRLAGDAWAGSDAAVRRMSSYTATGRSLEGPLTALAPLPTTSLHDTTLVYMGVRFTCPRCDSEGQEHRLVVSHADIRPDVVVGGNLLLAL